MDITENELKNIKAKQLRRIIRESIEEILKEDAAADKAARDAKKIAIDKSIIALQKKKSEMSQQSNDINEMARIGKGFRLTNPEMDTSSYSNKRVSGISLENIINYFRENPGAEKVQLQQNFNFKRPQIANALVNGLVDAGVLTKVGNNNEPESSENNEPSSQAVEPEDLFMGNVENPLSMYFDNIPNDDGSEDFNDEEEPTSDNEPVSQTNLSQSNISDEDYEAFMEYDKLKQRLDSTKSNILKLKRNKKGSTIGDIRDEPNDSEIERLRSLKNSLESKIQNLVNNSDYLKKRIGIEDKEEIVLEPEEEINEGLDEYTINKLQYYAGIKP